MWSMQLQPWGAQSISQRCLLVQSEQSRHNTISDWAVVKRRPQSFTLQPSIHKELSKDYWTKQGNWTIFVHQCKHWCKCFCQLTLPSVNTSDPKKSSKSQKAAKNATSWINNSSHHNPTKRVILCGKKTRAIRTPSQMMIAHDVVILSTKISPDALPVDTSVRSAQG